MNSTHSTDSTGQSMMFVNDTDVRMARTKIRGGLNLVYNLYEMNSLEMKSDFSINPQQSLDPFLLATSRGGPVELPSRRGSSNIDVTKCTKQATSRKRLRSVTKVIFDELWIYSSKSEEMKGFN